MANQAYKNVAKAEFDAYCAWIAPVLKAAADSILPREVVQIFMGYIMPDEYMHFEAVIRLRPRLFRFAWLDNDAEHQLKSQRETYAAPTMVYPEVVQWFNSSIGSMRDFIRDMGHSGCQYRECSIADQYKRNAARIRTVDWPVCDQRLWLTGSNQHGVSDVFELKR